MMLALLSIVDVVSNPATAWVIIPLAIAGVSGLRLLLAPISARIKSGERERLRRMYERLTLEKLDVIRTAITMGYKHDDLSELDARLEQVIGSTAMQKLLDAKLPSSGDKDGKTVIGISINADQPGKQGKAGRKAAATAGPASSETVDLDQLVHSELSEGLRRREREADRD
jgi:hypothetical protein